MEHEHAAIDRADLCRIAPGREAARSFDRRHRAVALAPAVRPFRLWTQTWPFTSRDGGGRNGYGCLDDLLCRGRSRLRAYTRTSDPRRPGSVLHTGFPGRVVLADLRPSALAAGGRSTVDDNLVDVRHP